MVSGVDDAQSTSTRWSPRATSSRSDPGSAARLGPRLLDRALQRGKPLVVDADGLHLLAEHRVRARGARGDRDLTPHVAEAAGVARRHRRRDSTRPVCAATSLARYGVAVILKGAGDVVAAATHSASACTAIPAWRAPAWVTY